MQKSLHRPVYRRLLSKHEAALLLALRMALSALIAYVAASVLHPAETSWAVMSAIIMSRGGQGTGQAVGGSAPDRLIGTLAGAGVGLVAGLGYGAGIPQYVLLPLAIAPLAFLSADYGAFRAAPIAALIVLSASAAGRADDGLAPAILRVGDVALGTLSALFVSQVALRSAPERLFRHDAARLMDPLAKLLALAWRRDEASRESFAKLGRRTRRDMRDLAMLARGIARGRGARDPADRLIVALSRVHGAVLFIARALEAVPAGGPVDEAGAPFVKAARSRFARLAEALAGDTLLPPAPDLDTELAQAALRIETIAHADPAAHLDALPFLLRSLKDDLDDLADAIRAIVE